MQSRARTWARQSCDGQGGTVGIALRRRLSSSSLRRRPSPPSPPLSAQQASAAAFGSSGAAARGSWPKERSRCLPLLLLHSRFPAPGFCLCSWLVPFSPSVLSSNLKPMSTWSGSAHSGGEREIERTMLELLNQLDGFDSRGDVNVILATNRIETLDPALLRPGRIDRKIEFPLPDIKTRCRIFQIHTSKMTLADDVNLEEFVMTKDEFSGADIKAICTEAGLLALRERRMKLPQVTHADFKKVMYKKVSLMASTCDEMSGQQDIHLCRTLLPSVSYSPAFCSLLTK